MSKFDFIMSEEEWEEEEDEEYEEEESEVDFLRTPTCPNCLSSNVSRTSEGRYHCWDCGYTWEL